MVITCNIFIMATFKARVSMNLGLETFIRGGSQSGLLRTRDLNIYRNSCSSSCHSVSLFTVMLLLLFLSEFVHLYLFVLPFVFSFSVVSFFFPAPFCFITNVCHSLWLVLTEVIFICVCYPVILIFLLIDNIMCCHFTFYFSPTGF